MAAMDEQGHGGTTLYIPGADPNEIARSLLLLCVGLQQRCSELKERAFSASCECSRLRKETADLRGQLASLQRMCEQERAESGAVENDLDD